MEDLAFRRMLDLFYESEKPLPCELKRVAKLIGMIDHQEEIRSILNEFWTETESGWVNDRAEKEINAYHSKAVTARANGKLGGRPKKPTETQPVNLANPEITGLKANHKPLTINQETLTSKEVQAEPKQSKFKYSEDDYKSAEWMVERIVKISPSAKPNIKGTANTIRLMREINNYSIADICKTFDWANKDSFWCSNVLSAEKLRKQWDKLQLQMGDNHQAQNQPIKKPKVFSQ